jgi:hypothetical protein
MKTRRHDSDAPVPEWLQRLARYRESSTQTEAQKAELLREYEKYADELEERIGELRAFGWRVGLR